MNINVNFKPFYWGKNRISHDDVVALLGEDTSKVYAINVDYPDDVPRAVKDTVLLKNRKVPAYHGMSILVE